MRGRSHSETRDSGEITSADSPQKDKSSLLKRNVFPRPSLIGRRRRLLQPSKLAWWPRLKSRVAYGLQFCATHRLLNRQPQRKPGSEDVPKAASWRSSIDLLISSKPVSGCQGLLGPYKIRKEYQTQCACGVGAFINSTNILLNLARSKSIWISTSCAPSFGLSLAVHVSVFP
jgi:hypothetical protein